nr:retrovirus-related Pol polyprotein from transposon TNT 1-94 [Tanacetum cinerariifolium]
MMRQNKNLLDINIDALYNIIKQNQGDVNDAMKSKKKAVVITSDPLSLVTEQTKSDDKKEKKKVNEKKRDMSKVKCYNCKKEGHFSKDCKKVKDYEYYKTKMLLAKKEKDEQALLAEDHAWMESSSDSDQEINTNMVFMAQIEKVLSDLEASSPSSDDKIAEVSYYTSESESESKYETLDYYDNSTTYGLFVDNNDDQEIFHDFSEIFSKNLIESQIDNNESGVTHNDSEDVAKIINQMIKEFDKKIAKKQKRIEKANQQSKDFENQTKFLQEKCVVLQNQTNTFEVKNNELNEQIKVLIEKNDDFLAQTKVLQEQLKVKHVVIDNHVECQAKYAKHKTERYEYMIRYSAYFDNDKQHRKQIADQEILFDRMSRQLVEFDKNARMLKNTVLEKDLKISELEECVRNKDLEIEKCLERLNECENKLYKIGQTNQTIHMIMPSKDKMYNGRKGVAFENPSYFCKAKELRPTLYDERVIGLGYTSRFLIHSDEALEIKKFKRARENKIEFAYDYGVMNASHVNEKIKFSYVYFQEIRNPDFEKVDSPFLQTSSLKPYVPTMILEKIIIYLEDEVVSLLEKGKENLEIIVSLKSKGFESSENAIFESENQSENDCQVVKKECDQVEISKVIALGVFKLNVSQSVSPISVTKTSCASNSVETKLKRKRHLDTLSSVKRPKHSSVIWKTKGSSNTSNVDLSSISHSKLNKDVKRYSRKDLLSCNNSHHVDTRSAYACNDAINVSCNSRLYASCNVNDLFVFDDMVQIYLWIIDSRCSKHMTSNRALLTNSVEKFLGTIRFGNNDFAVIVGYGDLVIGSMTIKKVYYVEGDIGVFVGYSKESSAFRVYNKQTRKIHESMNIMNSSTTNVKTLNNEGEVFHESSESFQKESSLYSLNDDVQQSPEEVILPQTNTQSISNDMIPNVDEASTSHNVFNKRLKDAYFDTIQRVRTDNGTEFKNKTLAKFFDEVGITQQFSAARTPQQNGVVERRNRTLVEAARTMLTFANLPSFLWAEAISTACFTQNHSIIHKRFDKTLYELINKRKPNIKFFHVFGCRCYLLNDYEDVGKLMTKGDIRVFVRYSKESAAFRIYNK